MKVLVTHDSEGLIKSIGFAAAGRQAISVKPGPHRHVSIVEIADLDHPGHLEKYLKGHRVDLREGTPRLVKT